MRFLLLGVLIVALSMMVLALTSTSAVVRIVGLFLAAGLIWTAIDFSLTATPRP